MKCFYHADRDAVGTCQTCGVTLCAECAGKFTPVTCDDCHRKMVAKSRNDYEQKKQEALIDSKSELIKATIKGLIFAAIFEAVIYFSNGTNGHETFTLENVILYFFFGFAFPYGWALISHFMPTFYTTHEKNFILVVVLNLFKFGFACLIGIPACLYQIIRIILKYKNAKAM